MGKVEERETLEFLQAMLDELSKMARREQYDVIAYLIEISSAEVADVLSGERPPKLGSDSHQKRN